MNCPGCRRGLDYIAELSSPNGKGKDKRLTYFCSSCSTLWLFQDFDGKTKYRGVLVLKRSNLKRAGFLEGRPLARASKKGE